MKTIYAWLVVLAFGMNTSSAAQTAKVDRIAHISGSGKVTVYYFHFTRRCATCNAVESVSKKAIAELYGIKVGFEGYNLDEEAGKIKGNELKVSGQALLIVSGNTKIDVTSAGFMNARTNPDKLKAILKEKIDSLL